MNLSLGSSSATIVELLSTLRVIWWCTQRTKTKKGTLAWVQFQKRTQAWAWVQKGFKPKLEFYNHHWTWVQVQKGLKPKLGFCTNLFSVPRVVRWCTKIQPELEFLLTWSRSTEIRTQAWFFYICNQIWARLGTQIHIFFFS